jgi:hypothetical protein|tara:strand:- start:194 stop:400 length:207 start_codon:yes stop_codon:yes gene_type:complete
MKFQVIGNHKVMGADKGDIIEIHDDTLINTLTLGGHIKEYKGKKRARNAKGHYIADDPKTEKNEAFEE